MIKTTIKVKSIKSEEIFMKMKIITVIILKKK